VSSVCVKLCACRLRTALCKPLAELLSCSLSSFRRVAILRQRTEQHCVEGPALSYVLREVNSAICFQRRLARWRALFFRIPPFLQCCPLFCNYLPAQCVSYSSLIIPVPHTVRDVLSVCCSDEQCSVAEQRDIGEGACQCVSRCSVRAAQLTVPTVCTLCYANTSMQSSSDTRRCIARLHVYTDF
jgi:hypothetical protein